MVLGAGEDCSGMRPDDEKSVVTERVWWLVQAKTRGCALVTQKNDWGLGESWRVE